VLQVLLLGLLYPSSKVLTMFNKYVLFLTWFFVQFTDKVASMLPTKYSQLRWAQKHCSVSLIYIYIYILKTVLWLLVCKTKMLL
jgi:hypothetical protein